MNAMLLLAALLAQAEEPVLANRDLLELNAPFVQLSEFTDNVFIHEEKLAEAEEEAKRYEGRRVEMDIVVTSVQKEWIAATFFPTVESRGLEARRIVPNVWFVNDPEADPAYVDTRHKAYIGRAIGQRYSGELRIGNELPLELAKTLRAGDRLSISGVIRAIKAEELDRSGDHHVARFVIVVNTIEKAEIAQE